MKKIPTAFLSLLLIPVIVFAVSSCSKANQAPVVIISQPNDTTVITIPDTMHIQGILTDDKGLHEASVTLVDPAGDTSFVESLYVHNLKSHSFKYEFFPAVTGTYTLKVTAQDHDLKSTTVDRNVTVN